MNKWMNEKQYTMCFQSQKCALNSGTGTSVVVVLRCRLFLLSLAFLPMYNTLAFIQFNVIIRRARPVPVFLIWKWCDAEEKHSMWMKRGLDHLTLYFWCNNNWHFIVSGKSSSSSSGESTVAQQLSCVCACCWKTKMSIRMLKQTIQRVQWACNRIGGTMFWHIPWAQSTRSQPFHVPYTHTAHSLTHTYMHTSDVMTSNQRWYCYQPLENKNDARSVFYLFEIFMYLAFDFAKMKKRAHTWKRANITQSSWIIRQSHGLVLLLIWCLFSREKITRFQFAIKMLFVVILEQQFNC